MRFSIPWVKYSPNNLPMQMYKVLCFRNGDAWVAQMINYKGKDHWIPLPFADSINAQTNPPDYWVYLDLPEEYTGAMRYCVACVGGHDEMVEFDELESSYPEKHVDFAEFLVSSVSQCLHTLIPVNIKNNSSI